MKIFLKGRNNSFFAEAIWDGKRDVKVLKGAKIANKLVCGFRFTKSVLDARNDINVVGEDFVLKHDIHFKSLTTAAQFVTGRSINGRRFWKNKDNISIEKVLREQ